MIPALFPFMIISGIMVRLDLTKGFTAFVYPLIKPIYRISHNGCYAMIMGFLCGFPMGAKTIADLMEQKMISLREGEFLLAFCNNIGPVYFTGFVLPLLGRELVFPYLFAMYGLPLLYGFILRHTYFRDSKHFSICESHNELLPQGERKDLISSHSPKEKWGPSLLRETESSIMTALQSMLQLGGYMILFNTGNLLPHLLLDAPPRILAPLLEITGGLSLMGDSAPLYGLILLPFGGLCCLAQTYSCIRETSLSISHYFFHKLILTSLTGLYYLLWFLCSSCSFLR